MKNIILTLSIVLLTLQQSMACAWYDPDYEYFNLFTQTIIKDKSYTPFLLTYSNPYYEDKDIQIPDDNIKAWQEYFDNKLSFEETKTLVYDISLADLNHLKFKRSLNGPILKKLGYSFYQKYKDAVDYLIEAKYIQPYMRIKHVENPDSWSYYDKDTKTAADLNFNKISSDLKNLYHAAQSEPIKLRYGYQLVRFYHYNRKYHAAIQAFNQFVKPHQDDSAPYYMALDQLAGAQRGLGMLHEANWNFFQVFKHSHSRKKSAYSSLKLTSEVSFEDLINKAKNKEDKVLAYFLLAYQDFNNPIPMMEKIYALDPSSEALMVLEARAINELERLILPTYPTVDNADFNNFKSKDASKDPRRIPIVNQQQEFYDRKGELTESNTAQFLQQLSVFTQKMKDNSQDAFWDISDAYLHFLQQDYVQSKQILSKIETQNAEYKSQIDKLKLLNDIVSQPIIDAAYEEHLMKNYASFFQNLFKEKNEEEYYEWTAPTTKEFLQDVLANRYYIQEEYAKSFLMSNSLTNLMSNPDIELTQDLETFYKKKNKSSFEKQILTKHLDVADPMSFFNHIYGDYYARNGKFKKALKHYEGVKNGQGFIPKSYTQWDSIKNDYVKVYFTKTDYNYFDAIPPYIFGHHLRVSYNSADDKNMRQEDFAHEFLFTQKYQNKAELMRNLIHLEKIGKDKDDRAAKANQLLGNVMYNTSKIGYYRHIFLFDINNGRSLKFDYDASPYSSSNIYYKNFPNEYNLDNKNVDLALNFYQKALKQSKNKEQKARILFQLANVEQAKFYKWVATLPHIAYDYQNEDYKVYQQKVNKRKKYILEVKKAKYNTYFDKIKADYSQTQSIQEIRSNCKYLNSYLHN